MMNKEHRKGLQADYRRKVARPGIYALRASDGGVWVGAASDLDAIANRVLFTLRQGTSPHRSLQAAWNAAGEGGLAWEELEELDGEELGLAVPRVLKERHLHWRETLGATRI
ncbi:GIY-YIG nuclease family protein [Novosphingobium mangrovi (ex Hu et al. 2023)]|uniref:GIY-YIG nuclease family protein n=1 Tax=Novosphingobium mangrovi (ex Hu et al. 2023) TaxID=2930094 RepID=A0ABT0AFI6_9SPHN|nr:GIY-YIG nuclease family protein [Novosphingobium mangrovi (ex Hu et al. 2023)]MCJ1961965.1 GIY-YIG nuclease family protein [Novosphingobium mangrovi (ex Hu et al. 2023)]